MGLYESLDQFVSAGVLACAPGIGVPMPPDAVRDGSRSLSALLRARGEAEGLGAVLDALAREIWLSQETRGLSLPIAEAHATALVEVLEACRPAAADVAAALDRPSGASRRDGPAPPAANIADDIVARAGTSGLLPGHLVVEHASFLIERMLALLLADAELLATIKPVLAGLAEAGAVSAQPAEPPPPQTMPPAIATVPVVAGAPGLPQTTRARLAEVVAGSGIEPALRPARIEELSARLAEVRARLLATAAPDATVQDLNTRAASALGAGDLVVATELLEAARSAAHASCRQAEQRLRQEIAGLAHLQTEQAEATARLAELASARRDFAAAARLYGEAAAGLPIADRTRQLMLQLSQAEAMLRDSEMADEAHMLRQSADLCAEVMRRAMAAGDHQLTALADLGLGQVLMRQAEQSDADELLSAAGDAFRRALASLDRQRDRNAATQALIGLGNSLALTFERDATDAGRLADAAGAYQDALVLIDRGATPVRWGLTQLKLGAALIRLGERRSGSGDWLAAAAAMLAALEALEEAGAVEQAGLARGSLRRLHQRLPGLLAGTPA